MCTNGPGCRPVSGVSLRVSLRFGWRLIKAETSCTCVGNFLIGALAVELDALLLSSIVDMYSVIAFYNACPHYYYNVLPRGKNSLLVSKCCWYRVCIFGQEVNVLLLKQ